MACRACCSVGPAAAGMPAAAARRALRPLYRSAQAPNSRGDSAASAVGLAAASCSASDSTCCSSATGLSPGRGLLHLPARGSIYLLRRGLLPIGMSSVRLSGRGQVVCHRPDRPSTTHLLTACSSCCFSSDRAASVVGAAEPGPAPAAMHCRRRQRERRCSSCWRPQGEGGWRAFVAIMLLQGSRLVVNWREGA